MATLEDSSSPSAKNIKKTLDSLKVDVDNDGLKKVITGLNGKNIEDGIAQGVDKLATVLAGEAVAVNAAPGSALPATGSAPDAADKKNDT